MNEYHYPSYLLNCTQGIHALSPLPGTEASGATPVGLRRSATVRNKSLTNNDLNIKKVPTIADFNSLLSNTANEGGLNLSTTSYSGSNPSVAGERRGSCRDDLLAMDLLRLLTIAKMGYSPKQGQQKDPPDGKGGGGGGSC